MTLALGRAQLRRLCTWWGCWCQFSEGCWGEAGAPREDGGAREEAAVRTVRPLGSAARVGSGRAGAQTEPGWAGRDLWGRGRLLTKAEPGCDGRGLRGGEAVPQGSACPASWADGPVEGARGRPRGQLAEPSVPVQLSAGGSSVQFPVGEGVRQAGAWGGAPRGPRRGRPTCSGRVSDLGRPLPLGRHGGGSHRTLWHTVPGVADTARPSQGPGTAFRLCELRVPAHPPWTPGPAPTVLGLEPAPHLTEERR